MTLSVVIRSRDEADRLRLTLASLTRQAALTEVVVVDDGSSDHTQAVLTEASRALPLVVLRHDAARGRSAASNAGAAAASGEILLLFDGDTLAGPGLIERHLEAHAERSSLIGRGEVFHLRCTRYLQDPEAASPRLGEEARLARLPAAELERMRVTRSQVLDDFAAIVRRAEPGIYPGAGPRLLNALEADALRGEPSLGVLWSAACGANLSVARETFLDAGGFDERLDINEHRELAFRLYGAGLRMRLIEGARSYHLTHRTGWRDPLAETGWEEVFWRKHPVKAVKLLSVFWASLASGSRLPADARIASFAALEAAALGDNGVDYDAARRALGLPRLDAPARETVVP
ncbi:MAG TPA: glycosyltransferase family 2 protein [Caulobacteraceae bacterium]|nr:glycosyltransferase family 2 protein [Caulobacteraceae bacterium]